ncbi:M16 family metallopeptidase [Spirosoma sp. KUDC1026]|uniref:M16 family metallopeptidase n=1 Tax=Spirosoma sp. KUDC1026 TaxID=2745947 RepID=UPI00159BEAC1|nr:pitrilysin family protein [Spirosoma sp. KUDC1026]QKZ14110.1 insulinase family protein [Spirosoma sp. KUDC1026]
MNKAILAQLARRCVLATAVVVGSASLTLAQDKPAKVTLPAGVTQGASVEGITEYQLKNGMKVLLFPDPSKPTVTVNITYLVGSRHEGLGETGMAHLLEHMVFKGSTKHPNIPQELTAHGARPNGTTWLDRTNYFETFAATDENLKWALDLESDRMVNSFIKKEDLATEFSVVRNEFEMGENSPQNVLNERVVSSAYLWHNYGNSTIGNRTDIEKVPIDNLQAFYKKFYQPDNAVLVVAGKIDEGKTLAMINDYFGAIPKPTRVLQPTYSQEPTQDGERMVTLRRVGDTKVVSALYHTMPGSHPDYPTLDVITEVLTNEPSGRLYKALVESKKASQQYGYSFTTKDPGYVYFAAEMLKDKPLDDAKNALLNTLDSVAIVTPDKAEIDRAKAKLLKDVELSFKSAERVGLAMSEYIATGDWRLGFLYRDALEKVTPADVKRVASYYFKPSNRTVGLFIPEQAPDRVDVPQAPDVAAMVKNYKGRALVAQGEAFDPSPSNIEGRTRRVEQPNTLELALLPKSTRGNEVNARLTLRYGDEKSLMNKAAIASLTAAMLDKGTTTRSRQQIKDELDKLKAQVNVYGSGNQVNANIKTTKENLPEVIRIVSDMLKNPVFNANEFEKLKQEQLAQIEAQRSEPQALAFTMYSRQMSPYSKEDIRYTTTPDEDVAMLNATKLDDLKQFHKDFYGASAGTFAAVGDFDEGVVKKVVMSELGTWKAKKPFSRLVTPFVDVKPTPQSIETPDKANAMMVAGVNLPLRDDDPDYPALVLGNYMLGGGFLNSRLAVRIRQKEGISYGVGSNISANPLDKTGSFMTYAIYNPENAERLEKAFREEMDKVVKEGFTADEINAARAGYLQSRMVSRAQDPSLASMLNSYLYLNRTMNWDAEFEKKMASLTPEQVNAAMKKHIDPSKISIIKAGDFANAAKKAAAQKPASSVSSGGDKK